MAEPVRTQPSDRHAANQNTVNANADELERFCAWFLKNMNVLGAVPFVGAVSKVEDVTSVLLFRKGQFQVQMFAAPEGTIIPEHTHPNVDSIEVYVGGNIHFSHRGKYTVRKTRCSKGMDRSASPAAAATEFA